MWCDAHNELQDSFRWKNNNKLIDGSRDKWTFLYSLKHEHRKDTELSVKNSLDKYNHITYIHACIKNVKMMT